MKALLYVQWGCLDCQGKMSAGGRERGYFSSLLGGLTPTRSEAFSFQVATDDQSETDRLWNAIADNGGQESAGGWCKGQWGLSWQITPRALTQAINDPDRAAAKRAFEAVIEMRKIDVAAIEAAWRG